MGSLGSSYDTQKPLRQRGIRVAIDRGGTFTDVIASYPDGKDEVFKLLSKDPQNYDDAPIEALRRIVQKYEGRHYARGEPLDLTSIETLRMGTTVATNALLEREGAKTALFITKGFKDLLKIGNQSRPDMFALDVKRPGLLHSKVIEVDERVTLKDSTSYQRNAYLKDQDLSGPGGGDDITGVSGEQVQIIQELDRDFIRQTLQATYDEGYRSIAVCFLHSYTFPDHELEVERIAREIGFPQISVSCKVSPAIRMLPRATSAVTDAYLTPQIQEYIAGFKSGVTEASLNSVNWRIMQSDGGLIHPSKLSGLRSLLSGPAGGVIGYARTCYLEKEPVPLIGFDMGGTSTDVSRYAGTFDRVFETSIAGVNIQVPQLDIHTVAAGGGSILAWRKGILAVGPESAGSHPGPACYRKGGPLTVTDANLILGRILPSHFPHIFGENQDQPLDSEISFKKMQELAVEINHDQGTNLSVYEVAQGFITVANETMCRPIRALTEARGHYTPNHNLSSFGGAGGQHACDIARALGVKRVLIHRYSSILSAYGMALADTAVEERRPYAQPLNAETLEHIKPMFEGLRKKTITTLLQMDQSCRKNSSEYFLNLRYDGSDTSLMVAKPEESWDFASAFAKQHRQEFGFTPDNRAILVDDVRVRTTAHADQELRQPLKELAEIKTYGTPQAVEEEEEEVETYFPETGLTRVPLYQLDKLSRGDVVVGPAIVIDKTQTIVLIPGARSTVLSEMLVIDIVTPQVQDQSRVIDPIRLSVFANRFMGIAEQMGRALQKTSISTNIKERLDFSCAIFSADGGLVANAPHVPSMLGSMAFSVRWQIQHWGDDVKKGDVFLSNAPTAGGTHLPDLTVITPIFDEEGKKILFWTASRGHHADIGGIVPGSMPANSRELWEEGAIIEAIKIVEDGVFQEAKVVKALVEDPATYPGCEGARCIQDNLTDIKAQSAANQYGTRLMESLIKEYTLDTVKLYMDAIQSASGNAVRDTLKKICQEKGRTVFENEDYLDDGSVIRIRITVDPDTGNAVFDYTGTSPQAHGNWNAPPAVCYASTIYTMRCLVGADIPLNQGVLDPIELIVPEDCLLSPSGDAACAAGNGLTAQRMVDVILKSLEMCAASNGCMANFTFGLPGVEGFGYYETICGGSGAGPYWEGEDGVHCHMTNTRITDPEILERRYPVILRDFSLRKGSGGKGKFRGGDGVVREMEFLIDMHVGILSERRTYQPYGLAGGENAARGLNLWLKKGGREVNLGGKNTCRVKAGDRVKIMTPGGGGYGHISA